MIIQQYAFSIVHNSRLNSIYMYCEIIIFILVDFPMSNKFTSPTNNDVSIAKWDNFL